MNSALAAFLAFVAALPVFLKMALEVGVIVGLFGSLLEEAGKRFNFPRLVAVGQQIEAVAVDVPKLVDRVKGWDLPGLAAKFRKVPPALVLCLGLAFAPAATGCAQVKPALSSAQVPQDVALGLEAASIVLTVADTITAAYLDGLKDPTAEQLADAAGVVDTLIDVKDALDLVRHDMASGRDRLREALGKLAKAKTALEALGVKVPVAVSDALATLSEIVK